MRLFRSRDWLLVALIIGLSACESVAPTHTSSSAQPSAAAGAAVVDSQRCARLAKRGFTPCPPPPDRIPLPPAKIRNVTSGAVSDTTAQQWGRAFQLAQAYYYWAMQHGARSALTSGALADPDPQTVGNIFGGDLQDLDSAQKAGGALVYQPPSTAIVQLVAIPEALQGAIRAQGLTPSPYGLAVRFTGPTRRSIRTPDGRDSTISGRDASFVLDALVWGDVLSDVDLGSILFEHGSYGCDGAVRVVCQL